MTLTAAEIAFSGNICTLCLLRTHESCSYCLTVFTFVLGNLYSVFASSPSSVNDRRYSITVILGGLRSEVEKQQLWVGRGGGGGTGSILWV